MDISYQHQSIRHIHEALSEGLTDFSGPSRAALIYAERAEGPLRLYDPQHLMDGWEPLIEKIYFESDAWRQCETGVPQSRPCGQSTAHKGLNLAGLVSRGWWATSLFYQMWFTEEHPTLCSTGPIERWLEHAACLLAHDWANEERYYTQNSFYVIREYARHAIRDYIQDRLDVKLGMDSRIEVYPILDAVLGVSKTREEGAWPRGELIFIDPLQIESLRFLAKFPNPEKLRLSNYKHVRKLLLAVENSDRKLVSDGHKIVGVARGELPECHLTADFRGGHGFLRISGMAVCSFSDGRFHSSNRKPQLVHLEELFLESPILESRRHALFKIVSSIVERAGEQRHGATLVIDLNAAPISISGQQLEAPIDLCDETMLDLAKSLSKVDGALHIGSDLRLHAFACLLDGKSIPGEDRARGARFNSALRFSAAHENLIVVVVSADRPVSVIHKGVDLSARPEWGNLSQSPVEPIALAQWLAGACDTDPSTTPVARA